MAAKKKEDNFDKLCRENWEYVYNIAFAICYDGEIARAATADLFYELGRSVKVRRKTFNSNEWMQNTVTRIVTERLHDHIRQEIRMLHARKHDSVEMGEIPSGVDLSREKIILLCEDMAVNGECFRNLTLGEKTVISLICVHKMSPHEIADYLKIRKADLEKLRDRGYEKITAAVNLFGKISYLNV